MPDPQLQRDSQSDRQTPQVSEARTAEVGHSTGDQQPGAGAALGRIAAQLDYARGFWPLIIEMFGADPELLGLIGEMKAELDLAAQAIAQVVEATAEEAKQEQPGGLNDPSLYVKVRNKLENLLVVEGEGALSKMPKGKAIAERLKKVVGDHPDLIFSGLLLAAVSGYLADMPIPKIDPDVNVGKGLTVHGGAGLGSTRHIVLQSINAGVELRHKKLAATGDFNKDLAQHTETYDARVSARDWMNLKNALFAYKHIDDEVKHTATETIMEQISAHVGIDWRLSATETLAPEKKKSSGKSAGGGASHAPPAPVGPQDRQWHESVSITAVMPKMHGYRFDVGAKENLGPNAADPSVNAHLAIPTHVPSLQLKPGASYTLGAGDLKPSFDVTFRGWGFRVSQSTGASGTRSWQVSLTRNPFTKVSATASNKERGID